MEHGNTLEKKNKARAENRMSQKLARHYNNNLLVVQLQLLCSENIADIVKTEISPVLES